MSRTQMAIGGACLLLVGFVLGATIRPLAAPLTDRQSRVGDAFAMAQHECSEVRERVFAVERVIDGDTFVVAGYDGEPTKVRILGIDAPERGEPGRDEATDALRELIDGSRWMVELAFADPRGHKRDAFGRLLCRVTVWERGRPVDAGDRLLELGLVQRYPRKREGGDDARGD